MQIRTPRRPIRGACRAAFVLVFLAGAAAMITSNSAGENGRSAKPMEAPSAAPNAAEIRRITFGTVVPVEITEFRPHEGRLLYFRSEPSEPLTLINFDYVNDKEIWRLDVSNYGNSLVVSPDGQYLAAQKLDELFETPAFAVALLDPRTGKELDSGKEHRGDILDIKWLRRPSKYESGWEFVTTSGDATVRFWRARDKNPRLAFGWQFEGGVYIVRHIAISPDGMWLAGQYDDGKVALWDVETRRVSRWMSKVVDPSFFQSDGGAYYTADESHQKGVTGMTEVGAAITALTFTPDGRRLVVGTQDSQVVVFDVETGAKLAEHHDQAGGRSGVETLAVSPDGGRVLFATPATPIRLWDWEQNIILSNLEGHPRESADQRRYITALAFTPDGKHALSGGADGTVRLWKLPE